ncbi:DMT family transporter [Flindersiella endophytica]
MPTAVLPLIALWLCWGTSFPAIRVMVTMLPPLLASGTVFCMAGAILAASRPSVLRGLTRTQTARAAGVGCCLLGAQGLVAVTVAEQRVYAGTAALLVATVPLWVSILRAFTGHRPTAAGAGRLGLGFAGAATVLAADTADDGPRVNAWALAVLGAAVLWAAGTVWASANEQPPPRPATVVQLFSGGLGLLIVSAATSEPAALATSQISGQSVAALAYLVAVDSLAGFALYNWLLRSAPISLVSTYAYAVPVIAYAISVIVLGEPFRPLAALGAAAIVAAIAGELAARNVDPV